MSNKFLLMFLFSLGCLSDLKSLSDNFVRNISIGAGTVAGLGATTAVAKSRFKRMPKNAFFAAATGLATGAFVGLGLNWYLKKYYTPKAKYNFALNFVDSIKDDYIFSNDIIKQKDLVNYIDSVWSGDYKWNSAKDHYSSIKYQLTRYSDNLSKAINELKNHKDKEDLKKDCEDLKIVILQYLHLVEKVVVIITDKITYNSALNFVDSIKDDYIFSNDVIKEEDFVDHINSVWSSSWPLISAKKHCFSFWDSLSSYSKDLSKVINELKNNKDNEDLKKDCEDLKITILEYFHLVEKGIGIIVNNKNYNFQMNLYNQHLERERQLLEQARQRELQKEKEDWERMKAGWKQATWVNNFGSNNNNNNKNTQTYDQGTQIGSAPVYPSSYDPGPPVYTPPTVYDSNYVEPSAPPFEYDYKNTQTYDQGTQTDYQSNQQNDFYPTQENFYPDLNNIPSYNP